ncbi:UNVERIFIED_ORG: hypothetical protein E4P37_03730 [Bacillus sp. AZ43]
MPTDQTPAADPAARPPIPTSVRVAVIAMGVLAALMLVNAGLTWYAFDTFVDALVEGNDDVDRGQAETALRQNILVYGLLGLLIALSAWFLPRRQPWARWVGLATSAALALLTIFSTLLAGGVTVFSLLIAVLSIAAVTSLMARTTRDYVPRLGARS